MNFSREIERARVMPPIVAPHAPRWYALQVAISCESRVKKELARDGIVVELPVVEERLYGRGRVYLRQAPFLPGYLFVRLDRPRGLADPGRGVFGLVRGACPEPWPVPDDAVAAIRALADADGVIRPKRALAQLFARGDQARVADGVWQGYGGEVLETMLTAKGAERVRLAIGLLKIWFNAAALVKV